MYHLARTYDFAPDAGEQAVLLDRLWPRGMRKQQLEGVIWEKDATPSSELRRWLHQAPIKRFESFAKRFRQELADSEAAQHSLQRIRELHSRHQALTLLTAARNPEHSHLTVLVQVLQDEHKAHGQD